MINLLNMFKKPKKPALPTFHRVSVKIKKKVNLYVGQLVSISPNENDNFYFATYSEGDFTYKIATAEYEYCSKYNYGVVESFNEETVTVCIICCEGYLRRFKVEVNGTVKNGDAFIVSEGNLTDGTNNVVGKIVDHKYNGEEIMINAYENGLLVSFIKK